MKLGLLLLVVEDFQAMLAFYRDVLGLEVTDEDPGAGYRPGVDWVQLAGDGGTIELFDHAVFGSSRELPLPRRNAVTITFRVDDVEIAVSKLQAAGVEITSRGRQDWGAAAHFRDPEGNELQVYGVSE